MDLKEPEDDQEAFVVMGWPSNLRGLEEHGAKRPIRVFRDGVAYRILRRDYPTSGQGGLVH